MADSFQVHLFDDPGVEMLPESSGCCAETIASNYLNRCCVMSLMFFLLFFIMLVSRGGFRLSCLSVLVTLGTLCFSDFCGSWRQA